MDTTDPRVRIFLSWSGLDSHDLAIALKTWLHDLNHFLVPWMSAQDIGKGQRWNSELIDELGKTNQGIICVTSDNIGAPWLYFEAGALLGSGPVETTRVRPVLLRLSSDQVTGPFATFQGTDATSEGDMLMLAQSINDVCPDPLPSDRLKRSFERCWRDYREDVEKILKRERPPAPTRSTHDITKDILDTVRDIQRSVGVRDSPAAPSSMPRLSLTDDV